MARTNLSLLDFVDQAAGLEQHHAFAGDAQRVVNVDFAALRKRVPLVRRAEPLTRRDRNRMSLAEFGGAYQYHFTRTRVGLEQSYPFLPDVIREAYTFYTMRDMVRKFRSGNPIEPYSVPRRVGEAVIALYETIPGRMEPVKASEVTEIAKLPLARAFRTAASVVTDQLKAVMQVQGLSSSDVIRIAMPATGLSRSTIMHAIYEAGETYPRLNAAMILSALEGRTIPAETLAWNKKRVADLLAPR